MKKIRFRDLVMLQLVVMIYTISGLFGKLVSGETVFSFRFFLFLGLEVLVLGIYALAWQQMIKKFDLSVAYINRSMSLLWSIVWSLLFFGKGITGKQALGCGLVVIGTMIVNSDPGRGNRTDERTDNTNNHNYQNTKTMGQINSDKISREGR